MSYRKFDSLDQRFWTKVRKGPGCWEWLAKRSNGGYGMFSLNRRFIGAHVMAYRLMYGDLPDGTEVHHVCENRGCVRPTHLRAVTHRANLLASATLPGVNAQKTRCPAGHPYDAANTYAAPGTRKRRCRTCNREQALVRRRAERLGDIGDDPHEVEFEPLTAPSVPEPAPVPVAPEPERPEPVPAGECVRWHGYIDSEGYGKLHVNGRPQRAHRVLYEREHGKLPEHLSLDHLCRNRACVNLAHLEPVTWAVNTLRGEGPTAVNARKAHCIHGHAFTPENTYVRPNGHRDCRTCIRARVAAYQARRAAA